MQPQSCGSNKKSKYSQETLLADIDYQAACVHNRFWHGCEFCNASSNCWREMYNWNTIPLANLIPKNYKSEK